MEHNVGADLDVTAARLGERVAMVNADGSDPIRYRELRVAAETVTAFLRTHGVGAGDRVAIAQGNSWQHVSSWYGIVRAGAVCVDLNIALSHSQWASMMQDCNASALLVDEVTAERAKRATETTTLPVPIWAVDEVLSKAAGDSPEPAKGAPEAVTASDLAVVAYTSGTTGLPKGVMHSHGGLAAELELLREAVGFSSDWYVYLSIPLFSLHGFLPQAGASIRVGGTLVVAQKFDAQAFADTSRRFPISYTTLSSPMIPALLRLPVETGPDLSALRLISCGGSPLHPSIRAEFAQRFGVHLTEGYSLTEVMGAFVMNIEGDAPEGASGRFYPRDRDDVMRIQDDDGSPLPLGMPGEIAFHASRALVGYWPERQDEQRQAWFPTGDIGRIDEDGFVYLLDRKKDVILRGGFTVYSAEIERILALDEDVAEATVVGVPDERLGEVAIAFVVPTGSAEIASLPQRLIDLARERLGSLKTPSRLLLVEYGELPRNALGKVIKAELRSGKVEAAVRR